MNKILVIEDEKAVRENLVELLRAEGYFSIEARDGEEGVRLAWEMLPDLILCDVMMPRLDGYGVLSRLSRDADTAFIPFIFLTARTEREDLRRGMNLGADDYITKPFSLEDVLTAIQSRLEKRASLERQAEQKLAELNKNIQYSLPHRLLTPLSIILSFTETLTNLQEVQRMEPRQVAGVALDIQHAAGSLLRSIQNYTLWLEIDRLLLDANRLRQLINSRVMSAWMTISEIANFKASQEGREEDLEIQLEDSPLRISEAYLQKVVEELLDNAFRYSPSGSPVRLTGILQADKHQYLLRVLDHGRGMSSDQITQVINFSRSNGQEHQSMSMGLAIVRRLVEIHNGQFGLQSQTGQWTVVELTLPVSD